VKERQEWKNRGGYGRTKPASNGVFVPERKVAGELGWPCFRVSVGLLVTHFLGWVFGGGVRQDWNL
jgi:hypothetical protein